ncbi:UNVERIFIED_CONTAM: hypothetical protein HDU68_009199 [Siphonaria sp. JEL0065]|nr:hypothetical protein HDU68_009199 [Siphonaria sp. JEL0065]
MDDETEVLQRQLNAALAMVTQLRQALRMEALDERQWKAAFNTTATATTTTAPLSLIQTLPPELLSRIGLFAGPDCVIPLSQSMRFFRLHFQTQTALIFAVAQAFQTPINNVFPTFTFPCLTADADDEDDGLFHDPTSNFHMVLPLQHLAKVHALGKLLTQLGGVASIKPVSIKWLKSVTHLLPDTLDVHIIVSSCDSLDLYDSDDSASILAYIPTLGKKLRTLKFCCYDAPYEAISATLPLFSSLQKLVLPGFIADEIVSCLPLIRGLQCIQICNATEFNEYHVSASISGTVDSAGITSHQKHAFGLRELVFCSPKIQFLESMGEVMACLYLGEQQDLPLVRASQESRGGLTTISWLGKLDAVKNSLVDWAEVLDDEGWQTASPNLPETLQED